MIEVEDGIPVPDKVRNTRSKYPWATMEVGQSVKFPVGFKSVKQVSALARKKNKPKVFRDGVGEDGITRIWRTA